LQLATQPGIASSMTSLEIAELVDSRHDNVRRTIERLTNQGVISLPPLEEVRIKRERREETATVYRFTGEQGKRDSIVVVAQLSPEFTARLVDRWQELEQAAALGAFDIPQDYSSALRLAADMTDKALALEHKVAEQAPKVEVYDRIVEDSGTYLVRAAAKVLDIGPRQLVTWMLNHGWVYRHADKGHLLARQDKLDKGWLAHKLTPFFNRRTQMNEVAAALRITARGLTVLTRQAVA